MSTRKKKTALSLKLKPQLKQHAFTDEWVTVRVVLTDSDDCPKTGYPIIMKASAYYEPAADNDDPEPKVGEAVQGSLLSLERGSSMEINDASGDCQFNLRFADLSMNHGNRKFVLCISPKDTSQHPQVEPCYSFPIEVVRYRLKITNVPESLWFKDQGGRDKCIELNVELINSKNQALSGLGIPLKATLCYHTEGGTKKKGAQRRPMARGSTLGAKVLNQDILKMSAECRRVIDDKTGKATIKVRIEEVSKNHQGQAFSILVAPDIEQSAAGFGVGPDHSGPIVVKSKQTRPRNKDNPSKNHFSLKRSAHQADLDHSAKQQDSMNMGMGGAHSLQPAMQHQMPPPLADGSAANGGPMDRALSGVIQWAALVVSTLQALQLQQIGFLTEAMPDGSAAVKDPLFRCVSFKTHDGTVSQLPMDAVAKLMSTYAHDTTGQLNELLRFAMQLAGRDHGGGGDAGGGFMSSLAGGGGGRRGGKAPKLEGGSGASGVGRAGGKQGGELGMPGLGREQSLGTALGLSMGGSAGMGMPGLGRHSSISSLLDGTELAIPAFGRDQSLGLGLNATGMVPPAFGRHDSLGLGLGGLQAVAADAHTHAGPGPGLGPGPGPGPGQRQGVTPQESSVYFILGRMFAPDDFGNVGLPAFSQQKQLMGFYNEGAGIHTDGTSMQTETQCHFHPLESFTTNPTFPRDAAKIVQALLENAIASGIGVFSLDKFEGDVVKMREDALLETVYDFTMDLGVNDSI